MGSLSGFKLHHAANTFRSASRQVITMTSQASSWQRAVAHSTKVDKHQAQTLKDSSNMTDTSTDSTSSRGSASEKSISQLDKELADKLAGRDGEGGSAAIEYEDGKPVAMKRSVKNNMFRYI